CTRTRFDYW
nr:immunoglobulin heavy chain junction region [Macaca mulatta]MOX14561.1 immunoglobulin heavy chain junction region [Macaca mulatta]MOX14607.1 immunoglobulin heavy chain junction region [Macaca mulatta]MOX14719.1 immunoglobulin heavy chain junction region [Macaca mulatta]MOX14723.1 immunoglobulin heavy chain junction region [Macaca mulatta]